TISPSSASAKAGSSSRTPSACAPSGSPPTVRRRSSWCARGAKARPFLPDRSRFALSTLLRHGRATSFMYRPRSAAVVVLVLLATGCAGLRRGSLRAREAGFGPAVQAPPDAVAMGSFLRGEVALTQNDMETALAAFQAAVRADPDAPLLRLRLAPLYVRSGQLDRDLEQVDAVVQLEPTSMMALGIQDGVIYALRRA